VPDDGLAIAVFLGLLNMQDCEVKTFAPWIIRSKSQQGMGVAQQLVMWVANS
jgi:hypothetical protein